MDKRSVRYGNRVITYGVVRRDRKTMAVEVHPDGAVRVVAPVNAAIDEVEARVLKRAGWILKQQRMFYAYPPPLPPREFVSGEAYRYLGRQYRLKILEGDGERVRLWRGRLEVLTLGPNDSQQVRKLVRSWFRGNATRVFMESYERTRKVVAAHGIDHQDGFKLFAMEKRWGSCTPTGTLLLSPALISAPRPCIDYVITHELVHTVEHNHGPRFTSLMTAIMPDWQKRRARLNEQVEPVLI